MRGALQLLLPVAPELDDAAQADGLDAHLTLDVRATSRLRPCKQQRERSARGHNRAKNFVLGEPASGLA